MDPDPRKASDPGTTPPILTIRQRAWRLITAGAKLVPRLFSLRNVAVLLALALGLFVWGMYDFLSRPIDGAHVFTGFDQIRVEPLDRQAPDGTRFKLYPGSAIFGCDVRGEDAHSQRVFPSHGAAMRYARDHGLPTMPSVSAVLAACRVADARLQVALEHALENHASDGRVALLNGWLAEIVRRREQAAAEQRPIYDRALSYVAQAIRIGGGSPTVPGHITITTFPTASAAGETPIGPWAADAGMAAIWHRDRFLASALTISDDDTAAVAAVLARSLVAEPQHTAAWKRQTDAAAAFVGMPNGLTFEALASALVGIADADLAGPLGRARVRAASNQSAQAQHRSVAPAYAGWASSPEEAVLSASGMTAWDQPIAALISSLQAGQLHLEPSATSGFYQRWWYALETLADPDRAPEHGKLQLTPAYTARWQRAFAAGFTDGRSGIVKRMPVVTLGMEAVGPVTVEVAPVFSCEPAPVVYLRLARAYRALARDLSAALGAAQWNAIVDASGQSVAAALAERSARLFGLAAQSYREIGYPLPLADDERTLDLKTAAATGVAWCAASGADADVTADARHLVTLAQDGQGHFRCPAIAGVRLEPVTFSWVEKGNVSSEVDAVWIPAHYWLTAPCVLTTTVTQVPTPEDFRRDCDRQATVADLYAAFHASPMPLITRASTRWPGWLMAAGASLLCGLLAWGSWRWWRLPVRRRLALAAGAMLALVALVAWVVMAPPYVLVRLVATRVLIAHENIAMTWREPFSQWSKRHHDTLFYDLIGDDDPQLRYWGAWLYSHPNSTHTPTPDQVAILDRALTDEMWEVSYIAWHHLCHSRVPTAHLLELLEKPGVYAQPRNPLLMLTQERSEDPELIAHTIRLATGDRPMPRTQAYLAIRQWKKPPAEMVSLLRSGIAHDDPAVRRIAVGGLAGRGTTADLPAILSLLTDPDVQVRIATLQTLAGLTYEIPKSVRMEPRLTTTLAEPIVQSALARYLDLPAASLIERINATFLVIDPVILRRHCSELLPLCATLPSSTEQYIHFDNGYAKQWTREQATSFLIMRYVMPERRSTWGRNSYEKIPDLAGSPWLLEHLTDDVSQHASFPTLMSTLGDALSHGKDLKVAISLIGEIGQPAVSLAQRLVDLHDQSSESAVRWWCASALADLGPEVAPLAIPRLQAFTDEADVGYLARDKLKSLQAVK